MEGTTDRDRLQKTLETEAKESANELWLVLIGHGTFDPIIPAQFGREASERLEAAGLDVAYLESPMAHSVDPEFLRELAPWIRAILE